jgi:serine/threonine-protein kinase
MLSLMVGGESLRVGRYAIYDVIASGGMATIHYGRLLGSVGFSRTVAIKRLHPQFAQDAELVAMFVDEAHLAARVIHPNVVPILDVVSVEGEVFLVMEYVQGESIARLIRAAIERGVAIAPEIAATVVAGALRGLHAAHEAMDERGKPLGIVHRDFTPQNILVGIDGVPRVVDFGVAKAVSRVQATTQAGTVKGKVAYMAEEQMRGVANRRTDVYAAAVVLWETLVGRRLFHGDNDLELLVQITTQEIAPPSAHAKNVPPALDAIVLRGLSRDPEERFATAGAMAQALEDAMPTVPAAKVGAWVDSLAADVLTTRSRRIASIESSASLPRFDDDTAAKPVESLADMASTASATSFVRPIGVRTWAAVAIGGLLVLFTVAFTIRQSRAPREAPAAAALEARSATAMVTIPEPPISASVAPPDTQTIAPTLVRPRGRTKPAPTAPATSSSSSSQPKTDDAYDHL